MIENKRGKITVNMFYDENNKFYVVTRTTPKTLWQDRYKDFASAIRRYNVFLNSTNEQLNNRLLGGALWFI